MKILLTAALIALAFVTYATPAAAYVVAVPMSVAASWPTTTTSKLRSDRLSTTCSATPSHSRQHS